MMASKIDLNVFNKKAVKKNGIIRRELEFDKTCGKILKSKGLFNWKPSDRVRAGVPDRYVAGGNWIEFKHAVYFMRGPKTLIRMFTAEQKRMMEDIIKGGDRAYVGIKISPTTDDGDRFWLEEWPKFKEDPYIHFDRFHSLPKTPKEMLGCFNPQLHRNSLWLSGSNPS